MIFSSRSPKGLVMPLIVMSRVTILFRLGEYLFYFYIPAVKKQYQSQQQQYQHWKPVGKKNEIHHRQVNKQNPRWNFSPNISNVSVSRCKFVGGKRIRWNNLLISLHCHPAMGLEMEFFPQLILGCLLFGYCILGPFFFFFFFWVKVKYWVGKPLQYTEKLDTSRYSCVY